MKKLRTPLEARAWLSHQGLSIAQWSRDNGFNADLVREILKHDRKCGFGSSHNIAVALGLKEGLATSKPGRGVQGQRAGAAA